MRSPAAHRRSRRALGALAALTTALAAALVALAPALAGGQSASAHDFVVSTSPAADQVVTDALTEVALTFNEPPLTELGSGIAVEVRAGSGANLAGENVAGDVSIVDSTLSVPVSLPAVGVYTVIWQTVSSDGHPVSGEYSFDYQGPVAAAPAPTGTSSGGSPTPDATGTPTAAAPAPETGTAAAAPGAAEGDPASTGRGVSVPLVLAGVVGALVIVALVTVVIVLTARRSRAEPGA
jgi:methionine-rich copper-binding protein CopC